MNIAMLSLAMQSELGQLCLYFTSKGKIRSVNWFPNKWVEQKRANKFAMCHFIIDDKLNENVKSLLRICIIHVYVDNFYFSHCQSATNQL